MKTINFTSYFYKEKDWGKNSANPFWDHFRSLSTLAPSLPVAGIIHHFDYFFAWRKKFTAKFADEYLKTATRPLRPTKVGRPQFRDLQTLIDCLKSPEDS